MRNKAFLLLIEQALMLLVFAVAAICCLRAFVWADSQSARSEARDEAVVRAQCAAEALKGRRGDFAAAANVCGGEWDGEVWYIHYDEDWNIAEDIHSYTLRCTREKGALPCLGSAEIEVLDGENCLVRLETAWQEAVYE